MTAVEVLPDVEVDESEQQNRGLTHTVCNCDPDVAYCGKSVRGDTWVPAGTYDDDCLVCEDLAQFECERCGE